MDATIELREVETLELAERLRFLGSPSVHIDGEDVDPSAGERIEYGLMCRVYSGSVGVSGTPPIAMVRAAIQRHAAPRSATTER